MFDFILEMLRKFVDKRICTVEQFTEACDYAKDVVAKDEDGFISVKDATKIIILTVYNGRK